jgi:predicted nuclease with RNAse H fold
MIILHSPRTRKSLSESAPAAGIDVGGPRKGFHAVVLHDGGDVEILRSTAADAIAARVRNAGARAIGVDAPCHWRRGEDLRPAERDLALRRIHCFATPGREAGESHPFYAWMRNGMALYGCLSAAYPLFDGSAPAGARVCFETFPQAIACTLAGKSLSARNKRADRRGLLAGLGIDAGALGSIDFIDAALCALPARSYLQGHYQSLGDPVEGWILLPAQVI